MEAKIEHKYIASQQHQRVNQPPKPTRCRPNVTLLEITFNQLKNKSPALHQMAREMGPG